MDPAPDTTDAPQPQGPRIIKATTVASNGEAVLILGPTRSGKSALALQMIALGAELVADDATELVPIDGGLLARAPEATRGLIEARGVGILSVPATEAKVRLVVDMGRTETDRLPPHRTADVLGHTLPALHKSDNVHFPAAVLLYLTHDRAQ